MPPSSKQKKKIQLLIPMSGSGSRFRSAGYQEPKPLIPVSGVPMIERVLDLFPWDWPCTFVLSSDHRDTDLAKLLTDLRPSSKILWIDEKERHKSPFKGPALAVYMGAKTLDPSLPVLVSYCDYGMIWDARHFERFVGDSDCDACLVSYRGFHAHYLSPTMYAYSRINNELVRAVREKGCFTSNRETEYASAGAYYFKSSKKLQDALEWQVEDKLEVQNEHYVSLAIEAMLKRMPQSAVRVFEIPKFCQWGTPDDLKTFEYWEKTFTSWNKLLGDPSSYEVSQILMPMAGHGSRFQNLSDKPKPFLKIGDKAMFELALDSLPTSPATVVVALDDHRRHLEEIPSRDIPVIAHLLSKTPPGQALSTEQGLSKLDKAKEVIVSACDHEIVLCRDKWRRFRAAANCDAAIFTIQGFPGAKRRPNAFAYVVPVKDDNPFPEVTSVSVKQPVSSSPSDDHLLVGTFWFKQVKVLAECLDLLKARNLTVNGELYLDSIFTVMIERGLKVRMITLDGYICRGDPDSLAESVYFQELFGGRSLSINGRFIPKGSQ
jgi:bifunctional N-acetylglucosamine-1-phosphate-uridyltransferase/glucosamine-1-phosphate-acetyltransferase GlmU-like protein